LFKNFDNLGFGEDEIKTVLGKEKEAKAKELRQKAFIKIFFKNTDLAKNIPKSVLDDENSLISMFYLLAKEKERKEKAKSQMLMQS